MKELKCDDELFAEEFARKKPRAIPVGDEDKKNESIDLCEYLTKQAVFMPYSEELYRQCCSEQAYHVGLTKVDHNLLDFLMNGNIGTSSQRRSISRILNTLKRHNQPESTQLDRLLDAIA